MCAASPFASAKGQKACLSQVSSVLELLGCFFEDVASVLLHVIILFISEDALI